MSLGRVAAAAEMDVSHLSRVERGLASPSVDSLARLARVLGLPELARLLAPYAKGTAPPGRAA
jgi:transcriptional regulator with XRE-family HTH domain